VSRLLARVAACALLMVSTSDFLAAPANFGASGQKASPMRITGAGPNWTSRNADPEETAYSRLDGINASNVPHLGLAWSRDLPGEVSLEATPLAIDGVLYFPGSYATVYAVDGGSGKLLWSYAPETWRHNPTKMLYGFAANRGVAYDHGRIFSAALDGRLFALEPKSGKLLWSVETTASDSKQTITGAPRTFDGKVIIGDAGADFGARAYVTAYDQTTGKQVWRFYTVPGTPQQNHGDPAMERAATTWHGAYWKTGTGGAVWDSITFDPDLHRIYLGTGNGGPYDPNVRSPGGGDNLYTASIVALDAATGKYLWHYQVDPEDAWDFDCTQQMTLANLVIGGKPRKVVMQAPKNGFLYVLDRTDGKLISAGKIGKVTWADHIDLQTGRPVEAKSIRYETGESTIWPGTMGAHSWMSQSYDPKTDLLYIPYMQQGVRFTKGKPQPGGVFVGGLGIKEKSADAMDGKGALIAWDPVRQKATWKAQYDTIWNGGAMSTAGNLVFQGGADGNLYAYNASSGGQLWRFYAGMGITAAPMSFSVHGKQYVSVLAGYGASAAIWGTIMNVGWKFSSPRRLLTFALDGKAVLPPSPPRDLAIHPVDDPTLKLNPADVAAGQAMYLACAACHGRNLVATGGPGPELRESRIALDPEAFYHAVHDGALMSEGMPQIPYFTKPQVMQIWAYIRAGARETLAAQKDK
jgi:quinohemoprotein ethanol dehydrogenase